MTVSFQQLFSILHFYTQSSAADLYILLFNAVLRDPESAGHGPEGYYFVENFQYSALEVAQAIAEGLVAQGIIATAETGPFTLEEAEKYFGVCSILILIESYHLTSELI